MVAINTQLDEGSRVIPGNQLRIGARLGPQPGDTAGLPSNIPPTTTCTCHLTVLWFCIL